MHRLFPLRVLQKTIATKIDITIPSNIPKIINNSKQKRNDSLLSDKVGILEMFNNQYHQEYKEYKRKAAEERSARGKDFIKKDFIKKN